MKIARSFNSFVRLAEFADATPEPDDLTRLVESVEGDGYLAGLTDEGALDAVTTELRDAYTAARASASTDADVEALTRLANAIVAADAEAASRLAAAADREASLAALDAQVLSAEDADDPDADAEVEAEAAEDADEPDAEVETVEVTADAPERVAASAARRPSLAGLARNRTRTAEPAEGGTTAPLVQRITAGAAIQRVEPTMATGNAFQSADQLGRSIQKLHRSLRVGNPSDQKHYVGSVTASTTGRIINLDELARTGQVDGALDLATARVLDQRRADSRHVASGGMCVAAQPDFSVTVVGERGTSFVQTLPTVTGSRPIQFYPWLEVDLYTAANREAQFTNGADPFAATSHVTAAEDAAGYVSQGGDTDDKTCLHIDCIDPVTVSLEATYKCVTVGNFINRAFPEFVAAFDTYTSIGFDFERDRRAMASVLADPSAKIVTAAQHFGATVDLLGRIRLLAERIRSTRGAPNLPIDVYVPSFLDDVIAQDIASSLFGGIEGLRFSDSQALAILGAEDGIFVNTYNGTGFGTTTNGSATYLDRQAAGALGEWPTQVRIGMWPTGTVFHQQAWELSFGLQEVGMATNDFSTFMELAEATHTRGSDTYFLDAGICVNGNRGGSVNVTCA